MGKSDQFRPKTSGYIWLWLTQFTQNRLQQLSNPGNDSSVEESSRNSNEGTKSGRTKRAPPPVNQQKLPLQRHPLPGHHSHFAGFEQISDVNLNQISCLACQKPQSPFVASNEARVKAVSG